MERGYNIKGENEEKNVRNGDRKVKRRCFRFAWKIGTKFCYEFSSSIGKRQSVISNKSFKLKTKRLYLLFQHVLIMFSLFCDKSISYFKNITKIC